jgi:type III secretory pathway component EscV
MLDEKEQNMMCKESNGNHLRLVETGVGEQGSVQLPESVESELRDLIKEIQRQAPRKQTAEDKLLPPAA